MDLGFGSLKRAVGLVLVEDLAEETLIGSFGDTDLLIDHGEDPRDLQLQQVERGLVVFELCESDEGRRREWREGTWISATGTPSRAYSSCSIMKMWLLKWYWSFSLQ
jgi:hypothetical protein